VADRLRFAMQYEDRLGEEVRPSETIAESRLADAALSKRDAADSVPVRALPRRLPRPNQRRLRVVADEPRAWTHRIGLRPRRGAVLPRLLAVRSPEQLDPRARRRTPLDCAHHDQLGIVAIAMVAVRGAISFFALRFILGLAEAGFFPGVILYLTFWFPVREQARSVALFMTATALAGVIAGPVSGALLELHGLLGLSGWQWLFILEGLPALILGVMVLRYLPDGPEQAVWLEVDERAALLTRLEGDRRHGTQKRQRSFREAIRQLDCLATLTSLFCNSIWTIWRDLLATANYPDFRYSQRFRNRDFVGDSICRRGDRNGVRRSSVGFKRRAPMASRSVRRDRSRRLDARIDDSLAAPVTRRAFDAAVGIWGTFGPFWAMPPEFLSGTAAAGAIALINSIGNLGGFAGPYLVGIVKQQTHSFAGGMLLMAASLVVAGLLALTLPVPLRETDAS